MTKSNPVCNIPDFMKAPWCDATLIMPRNTTKDLWNAAALERHCTRSGNRKYIISAEDSDTVKESGEVPNKETRLAIAHLKDDTTKNLKMRVELAIGMKAMVILNIAMDTNLANGTCGTVPCQRIILDPRENDTCPDDEGHIHFKYYTTAGTGPFTVSKFIDHCLYFPNIYAGIRINYFSCGNIIVLFKILS